jgi:GR25 family glycosyltransferase involved in LPS biosynthesis
VTAPKGPKMKVFVVSLANSSRRAKILASLKSAAIDVVIVDAIDARDHKSVTELISVAAQERMRSRYGRAISMNEVCAVLSHIAALRRISREATGQRALILEDDAALQREFPTIHSIAAVDADILIAGYTKVAPEALATFDLKNPFVRLQPINGKSWIVERYHNQTPGAVAYFVTPQVAAAMIRPATAKGSPFWLADDWGFYESIGLRIQHLHPPLFLENDEGLSYLETGRKQAGHTRVVGTNNLILLRVLLGFLRRLRIRVRLIRSYRLRKAHSGRYS